MGALVVNEVVLSYESEGETVRMFSDESREVGRLEGNRGDTLIHYWGWNLEGKSLESISIEFKARGSSSEFGCCSIGHAFTITTRPIGI
jgi:hypothetical protein